jgi:hypothetical protein
MIRKHVDVWAILLLLFVFAIFTRADGAVIRIVRARLTFSDRVYPMEVHISPWRLNHFHSVSSHPRVPPCRMI